MAYTLRINLSQGTVDSSNTVTDSKTNAISQVFNTREVKSLILPTGQGWYAISFGPDPMATYNSTLLIIDSDQVLDVAQNGTVNYLSNVTNMIVQGSLTQLQVRNNSGSAANVSIEIYA